MPRSDHSASANADTPAALAVVDQDGLRVRIQNHRTLDSTRQAQQSLFFFIFGFMQQLFSPQRAESDLEAGQLPLRRRGAQEAASEVAKRLEGILNQCYAACLPTCAMSYPLLKDAPDSVKLIMYVGLSLITLTVYIGMVSKSEARARLAIRLVSCTAVTVLTFSVASLLSVPTYVLVFTALAAGAMNLIILLLPI